MSDTYRYYSSETGEDYEVEFNVFGEFEPMVKNPPGRAHPGATPEIEILNEGDLPGDLDLEGVREEIAAELDREEPAPPEPEPEPPHRSRRGGGRRGIDPYSR